MENDKLEFEKKLTDSLTKEVVFSEYEGGTVILGIKDNKQVIGLSNPNEVQRKVLDIITHQISSRCVELTHIHIEEIDS